VRRLLWLALVPASLSAQRPAISPPLARVWSRDTTVSVWLFARPRIALATSAARAASLGARVRVRSRWLHAVSVDVPTAALRTLARTAICAASNRWAASGCRRAGPIPRALPPRRRARHPAAPATPPVTPSTDLPRCPIAGSISGRLPMPAWTRRVFASGFSTPASTRRIPPSRASQSRRSTISCSATRSFATTRWTWPVPVSRYRHLVAFRRGHPGPATRRRARRELSARQDGRHPIRDARRRRQLCCGAGVGRLDRRRYHIVESRLSRVR